MASTGRPLLFAVIAIVTSFVFALWLSQHRLNHIEQNVYEIAANAEPSVVYLENAQAELDRVGLHVDEYVAAVADHLPAAEASRVRTVEAHDRMQESLAAYERLPFFPGEEAIYRDAQKDLGPIEQATRTILARAEAGDLDAATRALLNDLHPVIEHLSSGLKTLVDYDTAYAVKKLEAIAASRRSSWRFAVVGGSISLLLSLVATLTATYALWKTAKDRCQIEEERVARLAVERDVRRRDEFLALVSHQLRTPLTALKLAMDALTRKPDRTSPVLQSTAADQVNRMSALVEDLVLVAQVDLGSIAIEPQTTDLLAIARERIQEKAIAVKRSGSTIHLHGDAPVIGKWDASALGRVIDKLLSNAINFGEARPIDVTVSQQGARARLLVRDRGIGIPPDRIAYLFERFERGVSERNYPGLGLGLYIARSLLRTMGGTIQAASNVDGGATLTVELPLEPTAPQDRDAAARGKDRSGREGHRTLEAVLRHRTFRARSAR
jgi:signal transduction histidine kinase